MADDVEKIYSALRANGTGAVSGGQKANEFHPVSENEILQLESDIGFKIPSQLRKFYLDVGWGFLDVDSDGKYQNDYPNNIVSPDRLRLFWKREEVSFQYDSDLVDKDELAFFDMGDFMYLVVRPFSNLPNAVYYPRDSNPVSEDFESFIASLYRNTTFYL